MLGLLDGEPQQDAPLLHTRRNSQKTFFSLWKNPYIETMKEGKKKFVLYTNPNNVTDRAYTAVGASDSNEILKKAQEYPDSYSVLFQGKGNTEDIQRAQAQFSHYRF